MPGAVAQANSCVMSSGATIVVMPLMLAVAPCSSPCASAGTARDRMAGMANPDSANGSMDADSIHGAVENA